jgi:glycosyltransferase involved in cell wall biosynthesis
VRIRSKIRIARPEAHSLEGIPRVAASSIHGFAVAQELRLARLVDSVTPRPAFDPSLIARATALIKTFERPRDLRRLLASIKRLYPMLEVVVVDDSTEPSRLPDVKTVALPYDTGVAAGRNEGLSHVTTPYVVVLDDDLVFFRGTRLEEALALLEQYPEIDLVGGQVIDLPLVRSRQPPRGAIFATDAVPVHPLGTSIGGREVVDKVPNFFVARRDRLELVQWDPLLKRMEHADFFTRALGTLTTVFDPSVRCFHARTPFDASYMAKRLELGEDSRILTERYGA